MKFLLEKIRDVIKDQSSTSSILIIMFFCLRIMLLRTSDAIFNETFGTIWPVLFSVLISIFNNELLAEDLNLKLAALKLLEMTMLMNYENIYLSYWAFGFDVPEISFDENVDDRLRPFVSQFPFIPFLSKMVKKNLAVRVEMENSIVPVDYLKSTTRKRKVIVKKNKLDSENELSELTFEFMQYMVKLNTMHLEIDENELNEIIMEDFIKLNEFGNA